MLATSMTKRSQRRIKNSLMMIRKNKLRRKERRKEQSQAALRVLQVRLTMRKEKLSTKVIRPAVGEEAIKVEVQRDSIEEVELQYLCTLLQSQLTSISRSLIRPQCTLKILITKVSTCTLLSSTRTFMEILKECSRKDTHSSNTTIHNNNIPGCSTLGYLVVFR